MTDTIVLRLPSPVSQSIYDDTLAKLQAAVGDRKVILLPYDIEYVDTLPAPNNEHQYLDDLLGPGVTLSA